MRQIEMQSRLMVESETCSQRGRVRSAALHRVSGTPSQRWGAARNLTTGTKIDA